MIPAGCRAKGWWGGGFLCEKAAGRGASPTLPAMRLTLVTTVAGSAGLDRHFAALCNGLAARGHAVTAIGPPAVLGLLAPDVAQVPWAADGARWHPLQLARLAIHIRKSKPDLVHAHGDKAAAMTAWAAPRSRSAPVLVATAFGFKRHYDAFIRFDRLIAVSAPLAAAAGHPRAEVVFSCASGQTPDAGAGQSLREWLTVPYGAPVALAMGPLVPDKGFDVLLDIWPEVGDAELWLAGDGPEKERLAAQARDRGTLLEGGYDRGARLSGVRLLGVRDDRPALLAACDLVVIPSRRENFSHFLAEALLAGKPVVSTDHPLAVEFLPPEYVVPQGNAAALREAVVCVLANLPLAAAAQGPAFARARAELSESAMAEATWAVYGRALQGRRTAQ